MRLTQLELSRLPKLLKHLKSICISNVGTAEAKITAEDETLNCQI
jgi:hypothetical protein